MFNKVESIYVKAIEVFRKEDVTEARSLIREDDIVDQMERPSENPISSGLIVKMPPRSRCYFWILLAI